MRYANGRRPWPSLRSAIGREVDFATSWARYGISSAYSLVLFGQLRFRGTLELCESSLSVLPELQEDALFFDTEEGLPGHGGQTPRTLALPEPVDDLVKLLSEGTCR